MKIQSYNWDLRWDVKEKFKNRLLGDSNYQKTLLCKSKWTDK